MYSSVVIGRDGVAALQARFGHVPHALRREPEQIVYRAWLNKILEGS